MPPVTPAITGRDPTRFVSRPRDRGRFIPAPGRAPSRRPSPRRTPEARRETRPGTRARSWRVRTGGRLQPGGGECGARALQEHDDAEREIERQEGTTEILVAHQSEEHTSELQSPCNLVCRLLLEK